MENIQNNICGDQTIWFVAHGESTEKNGVNIDTERVGLEILKNCLSCDRYQYPPWERSVGKYYQFTLNQIFELQWNDTDKYG